MHEELGRKEELNEFEDLINRYRHALETLQVWGLRISTSSRLRVYERRLDSVGTDASIPVDSNVAYQLMFDLREVDEITEIVESFSVKPSKIETRKLQAIITGAEHPDEEAQSAGRDTQYELYLRALLARSPIKPELGEPDLLIRWKGVCIPVEAKRPKNQDRFDDNLRRAVSQLAGSAEPGIIAISLDQMLRPPKHHLSVPSPEMMMEVPSSLIEAFIERKSKAIARRVVGRNVAALLFTLRIPAQVVSTGQASLATGIHVEPLVPQGARGDRAVDFLTTFIAAGF